jgi:hypothetical protein
MAAYTTVNDPGIYFNPVAYDGTTSGAKVVTGVGFQPDLIWFKLTSGTYAWACIDSVRGVTSILENDNTATGSTNSNYLASFDSDGFSTPSGRDTATNSSGGEYIAYCWKAGTTSGITTDGSTTITPNSYSFNADAGFSIIGFDGNETSGAGIPHGLGIAPSAVVNKAYAGPGGADAWNLYNADGAGNTFRSCMDRSAIPNAGAGYWNNTSPDTVNTYLGSDGSANGPNTNVAYNFTEIQGYSRFNQYIGNGNADGTFVYLGFKPAFIFVKRKDAIAEWFAWDNKRLGYNVDNDRLMPSTTNSAADSTNLDLLSNGFKFRNNDSEFNASAGVYFYWAWAESPFVNAEGVPVNSH